MTNAPVFIRCVNCAQKLRVPTEKLNQPGRCPCCKTPFPPVELATAPRPAVTRKPPECLTRLLVACCWFWLASVIAAAALSHLAGETWWLNTMLLYSPRWLLLVPAAVLAPFAACWRLRSLAILISGCVAWLFLIAGLSVHLPFSAEPPGPGMLRVLTCNMQGRLAEPGRFLTLLTRTQPDVVLLQGWPGNLNHEAFGARGWNLVQSGDLWVASRLPIRPLAGPPADTASLS